MADTARTKADLIALFPDNTAREISEQDIRDFVESVHLHGVSPKESDFGAVGDGTTDDTAAWQALADALSDGDVVTIPAGEYKLTDWVDFGETRSLRFRGQGGGSSVAGSFAGASIVVTGSGGFRFNGTPTSLIHEGPVFETVNFIANKSTGDPTLVQINDMDYFRFYSCAFRSHDTGDQQGIGVHLTQTVEGGDNAWGTFDHCRWLNLTTGIDSDADFGHVVMSGNCAGCATGFHLEDSQSWRIIGTKFDNGVGIHILDGAFHRIVAASFESCTTGIRIQDDDNPTLNGNGCSIIAPVFAGNGSHTDFNIDSTISDVFLVAPVYQSALVVQGDREHLNVWGSKLVSADNDTETVTTGSPTLQSRGITLLDSSGGAITATQPDGPYEGAEKTIVMTDATTSSTVSVSNHETSDPEVFTFNAVDEYLKLIWTGTQWSTIGATATT